MAQLADAQVPLVTKVQRNVEVPQVEYDDQVVEVPIQKQVHIPFQQVRTRARNVACHAPNMWFDQVPSGGRGRGFRLTDQCFGSVHCVRQLLFSPLKRPTFRAELPSFRAYFKGRESSGQSLAFLHLSWAHVGGRQHASLVTCVQLGSVCSCSGCGGTTVTR